MGPSGAGKSTLMDMISARKSVGRLSGEVLVNGAPRGADFARKTAYVPQVCRFQAACAEVHPHHAPPPSLPRQQSFVKFIHHNATHSLTTSCRR